MFIRSLFNRFSQTGDARFQRDLGAIVIGLLVATYTLGTHASELDGTPTADAVNQRVATSTGVANNPLSVTDKIAPISDLPASKPRVENAAPNALASKSGLFNDFEIFDAEVALYFDDDFDGHYYGIDVNFDADTDYASADVYAMLYLSLDGGPWELYYTTRIFTLFGDSGGDDFTVETELYSGYPTAYYDVLIELFDADTGDFVAEFGPADSLALQDAPLEDQQKDAGVIVIGPEPIISQSRGGGGSFSLLALTLLSLSLTLRTITLKRSRPKVAPPVTSRSTG